MRRCLFFLGLVLSCGSPVAQVKPVGPGIGPVARSSAIPAATAAAFQAMAARATVIFAGHVLAVDRQDAAGYVDVTFAIDRAARGCGQTDKYVLREWAGLWTGEPERYRVGAQLLMLLPARGASGMSEPVGGMAGAIPLVATRIPPLTHGAGVAPADTGAQAALEPGVDLRWVQALAVRGVVATASGRPRPEVQFQGAGGAWAGPVAAMPALGTGASAPGLSAVLALAGVGGGR
jgi:hypothetical protein